MQTFLAFIPVLRGLISGQSLSDVLSSFSLWEWTQLAKGIAAASPQAILNIAALDAQFEELIEDISTLGPEGAAKARMATKVG